LPQIKNPHLSVVWFLKSWQRGLLARLPGCLSSERAHYTGVSGGVKTSFQRLADYFCCLRHSF
ncbi:hypothetical protein, partial [Accumulibacter sp.]|uniref:hypothetical protein n=1 Tax=Accumulibacter sp. TaxID=2053492 RepID=UPI002D02228F